MQLILLGIIGIFALHGAEAEGSCATNPLLGIWKATNISVQAYSNVTRSCDEAALSLTCNGNNELELRWAYNCGGPKDWFYGGHRKFVLNGERLTGVDGELKADSFYWDGLIPKVEDSTKIDLKLRNPGQLSFEISENPKSYYPEDIFRGTFTKVTSAPDFLFPKILFPEQKLNGDWNGQIRILGEKETICNVTKWNIRFERQVMWGTQLFLPNCGEVVNFSVGPNFIRGGDVFSYPREGRGLTRQGTATAKGFERNWEGSAVTKEKVELGEGTLTYRIFTRNKEYRLELKRP
jgi:hypothetical protein